MDRPYFADVLLAKIEEIMVVALFPEQRLEVIAGIFDKVKMVRDEGIFFHGGQLWLADNWIALVTDITDF